MKREIGIGFVAIIAFLAFFTGWHSARWQTGHDCRYLGGFMTFGKVYTCDGMTEAARRQP